VESHRVFWTGTNRFVTVGGLAKRVLAGLPVHYQSSHRHLAAPHKKSLHEVFRRTNAMTTKTASAIVMSHSKTD